MQKILDAIIDQNQLVATRNRTILHTFSTIRDVTDVPYKSNLALISLNFHELFTGKIGFHALRKLALLKLRKFVLLEFILPFLLLIMETNSST